MFAFAGVAEARRASQNTQYSQHEDFVFDPIADVLGGAEQGWAATPTWRHSRQSRQASNTHSNRHASNLFDNDEDHYYGSSASIVAYGRMLQHAGFRVSEHPSFGGVHHVHHGWAHYAGRAIDVNVGRGVVEARSGYAHKFDQLAANARAAGYTVLWRVPGHYNHIHIQH
jgi:hypothetical protein